MSHNSPSPICFTTKAMLFGVGLCLLAWPMPVVARSASNLAASLARLRSEVESLSSRVEEQKQAFRNRLRSLAMRKSSLALQLQQANLGLQQARRKQLLQQQKIARSGQREASIVPVLLTSLHKVRAVVKRSLPFRRVARLRSLATLEKQIKGKVIAPRQAASRLWQFVEDELRLGRENGLYRQMITLKGKQQLVDVARLGMVMLFFKTRDGKVGSAQFYKRKWQYQLFQGKASIAQVTSLFLALRQQIRVGFWTLPNQLQRLQR